MKNTCYLTKKHDGVYFDVPYDADFLDTLKRHVPAGHRKWNPDIKQWWVSDKYAAQAERDCRSFYANVIEC